MAMTKPIKNGGNVFFRPPESLVIVLKIRSKFLTPIAMPMANLKPKIDNAKTIRKNKISKTLNKLHHFDGRNQYHCFNLKKMGFEYVQIWK
jgi:hypothetical protein